MLKMRGVFFKFPPHLDKKVTCIKFCFFLVLNISELTQKGG